MSTELYAIEVERHLLALRETLVRFDENWKALQLLEHAPYIVESRPAVRAALADQRAMCAHALDPDAYASYYATNPHEAPFEHQYGMSVEHAAAGGIPRLRFLLEWLGDAETGQTVLDLSMNDGWMLEALLIAGYNVAGCDLNPHNVQRARDRLLRLEGNGYPVGRLAHCRFEDFDSDGGYPYVTLFETIEHLPDPAAGLAAAAAHVAHDGRLYVSTPLEAVEQGNLPNWAYVEPKGHLWAWTASQFRELLEEAGEVTRFEVGSDRVMVAEVIPRG